jgi:hypothetical protein
VYHGLPDDFHGFQAEPGGNLAFLSRICPEKEVDWAIAIAAHAGVELKIAAKVDPADEEYFETEIRHLLNEPLIDPIGDGDQVALLGGGAGLAHADRLAGAVGAGRDRSHGLRHAGDCVFLSAPCPELVEPGVNAFLVKNVGRLRQRLTP